MLKFEMKKVFSKPKNRIAVLVMILVLIVLSFLTINRVEYVDEDGNHSTGISAARELRAAKNEWAGPLTGDVLQEVIAENDKSTIPKKRSRTILRNRIRRTRKNRAFPAFSASSAPHSARTGISIISRRIMYPLKK